MTISEEQNWVECLVYALRRVDEVQGEYRDEVAEQRRRREREEAESPYELAASDPAGDLRRFYQEVCYSGGHYADGRYAPLRSVLRDAESVLGRHPALAAVLKEDERWEEFVVRTLEPDHGTSRLAMVAGLLRRRDRLARTVWRSPRPSCSRCSIRVWNKSALQFPTY